MSDSILQVNQIKDKGGNATGITVADTTANVTINRPLTASSGIANAGTITEGTLGDNIIHSVGWQHIETKSCPTNVDSVSFTGIFTDDYVAFDFEMAMEPASGNNNADFFIQFLDDSNNAITGGHYASTLRWYPSNTSTVQLGYNEAQTSGRLIYGVPNNSSYGGFRGTMRVRNVSAPTLDGVDTDRGTYRHDINFTGSGYLDSRYSYATNYLRYNNSRQEDTTMGIKIFIRETGNSSQAHNFASGSWITCFGLKGKSTS